MKKYYFAPYLKGRKFAWSQRKNEYVEIFAGDRDWDSALTPEQMEDHMTAEVRVLSAAMKKGEYTDKCVRFATDQCDFSRWPGHVAMEFIRIMDRIWETQGSGRAIQIIGILEK